MIISRKAKIIIMLLFFLLIGLGIYYYIDTREVPEPTSGTVEGSPFSCTWTKPAADRLRIEVHGELPKQHEWRWRADEKAIEVSQGENDTVFNVRALAESLGVLTLSLRDTGIPLEKGADIVLALSVDSDKNIRLDSGRVEILEAESFAGDDGVNIYWKSSSIGGLFVYLTGTTWHVQSNEGVIYTGPTVDGDRVRLEIIPEEGSDAKSLVIIDNATDKGYELRFTGENGALDIEECISAKAEEPESEEEIDPAYEALLEAMAKAETEEEKNRLRARYWLSQGGSGQQG